MPIVNLSVRITPETKAKLDRLVQSANEMSAVRASLNATVQRILDDGLDRALVEVEKMRKQLKPRKQLALPKMGKRRAP